MGNAASKSMKFRATSDSYGFLTKDGVFTPCLGKDSAISHGALFGLPAVHIEIDSERFKAGLSHNRMRDLTTGKVVKAWSVQNEETRQFWAEMARGLSPAKLAKKSR